MKVSETTTLRVSYDGLSTGSIGGEFGLSSLTSSNCTNEAAIFRVVTAQPPTGLHSSATNQTVGTPDVSATALTPEPPLVRLGQVFHELASPRNSLPLAVTGVFLLALFIRRNPLHAAWRAWWQLLSRLGNVRASVRLAELCRDSRYTQTSPGSYQRDREVRKYLKRAAKAGHVEAALRLGKYYLNRSAGDRHGLTRAERYLRQAAAGGLTEAHYELGKLLQILWRFTEAYELFQQAAKTGHVEAMCAAAGIAERHLVHALGAEAVLSLYRRAAEAGSGSAALRLAELLTDGKLSAPDYRQALQWLRSKPCRDHQEARSSIKMLQACGFDPDASEGRVIEARLELAMQYWQGKGSARNPRLAWKWALRATDTGDPRAEYLVGKFLLDSVGVLQDSDEAEKHLEVAARRGISVAQFELARLLSRPGATPAKWEQAYAWASLAAMQGEPEYVALRDRLTAGMEPAACRRAAEFARELALKVEASPPAVPQPTKPLRATTLSLARAPQRSGAAVPRLART